MATTTYEPIETYTLGSAASSVTFGSGGTIPQTYTDLVIVGNTKNTANNGDEVGIRFNADTGSNYSRTRLYANGSSAASDRSSNTNKGALGINSTSEFTPFIANVQNYSNSTTNKTVLSRGTSPGYTSAYVSLWRNTAAITSITILPDSGTTFVAGSTFTLYGIANADIGAKATGGVITYDDTYFYHTFGASGAFTPKESLTVDYLVVAGGGGGGNNSGGGGGAGGYRSSVTASGGGGPAESALSLTAQAYTVTVGAGGATSINDSNRGGNGSNSVFSTVTSTGGGGGGTGGPGLLNGATGGSGGAPTTTGSIGTGTANQGNDSGLGITDGVTYGMGGGGGGAGAVGQNAPLTGGGAGGIGLFNAISNAVAKGELSGGNYYLAGGGGGSGHGASGRSAAGAGGIGGGGAGARGDIGGLGTAGTVNTGGGAGCAQSNGSGNAGGGSGIVIVRYAR
jgi:hypothetical protein